jgi:protein TonB
VERPDAPVFDSDSEQSTRRKPAEANSGGIVPAKILSQPQPPFPSWAKGLDLDGVVTLDAVIDEKGNVTTAKPLSGPRPLQRAAEQAVGLWEFEPARSGGKPIASHMTLTVEFKR